MTNDDYTIGTFRCDIRTGRYAWPGGYPTYFICNDGAALCYDCAKDNRRLILEAIRDRGHSGWRVIRHDVNWEDEELTCDYCGKTIESAYGSD